ncbi:MAG: PKD domain-containing protein [Isosphaeraceae bacterium]
MTATFTASAIPIIVNAGGNVVVQQGTLLTRTCSFTDPPGDGPWTATVLYGDGTPIQPLVVTGQSFTLSHIFANAGTFTTIVTVTNREGVSGSFSYQATVSGFSVNDGNPEPSAVKSLTYTFASPTLIEKGSFELFRDGKPTKFHMNIAPQPDRMTYLITFSGPGVIDGSLPDAHYTLITLYKKVKVLTGPKLTSNDVNTFVSRLSAVHAGKKDPGTSSKPSKGEMDPPKKAPAKFPGRTVQHQLPAHRASAPVRAAAASPVKALDRPRSSASHPLPLHQTRRTREL